MPAAASDPDRGKWKGSPRDAFGAVLAVAGVYTIALVLAPDAADIDGEPWVSFFEYLASGAAAVLGLAFVTFQVRSDTWRGESLRIPVVASTLAELAAPVFFGLMFLLPTHPWVFGGFLVGGVGYAAVAWHAAVFFSWQPAPRSGFDKAQIGGDAILLVTFGLVATVPDITAKAVVC